jgi:hypothetical protein
MKTAIMQPYIFPYIGYFQLIQSVERFVICDNYQYTRKGWINRNQFLQNGKAVFFTIPLKDDAQHKDIRERQIASDFQNSRFLNQIKAAYQKSPFFPHTFPLLKRILQFPDDNLFNFLANSIAETCNHLRIGTKLAKTSDLPVDRSLKKQERVLAMCSALDTTVYINSVGGRELYSKDDFKQQGITLQFLESKPFIYRQFESPFVPQLSIIDVLMFNSPEVIQKSLTSNYELT